MAVITTDEQFRLAASNWIETNPGVFQGTPFVDASGRKIYDERPQPVDVTPSTASLEAALDSANAQVAADASEQTAHDILINQARKYILSQLDSPSPVATIYGNVRPVIDGNAKLATRINTLNILATGGVPNWTLNLALVDTDPKRKQYLMLVLWLFPVVSG